MAANILNPTTLSPLPIIRITNTFNRKSRSQRLYVNSSESNSKTYPFSSLSIGNGSCFVLACLPLPSASPSSDGKPTSASSTKLYVSGLSFRTTEESLRNAFKNFGELVEVNLVMDKIANRPRGFAFLRYVTEEESQKAIEGMHGKFLDGRVIFVEVAKPRSELRQRRKEDPR